MSPSTSQNGTDRHLLLKNTAFLVGARALGTPLAMVVNIVMARFLGPEDFGRFYLASTFANFASLVVAWGQNGTLPALVAQDRKASGPLLGSSIAGLFIMAPAVYSLTLGGCYLAGYSTEVITAVAIVCASTFLNTLVRACQATIRGFERTDVAAAGQVGTQFLNAALVIPALFAGGTLTTMLSLGVAVQLVVLFILSRLLKPIGVTPISVDRTLIKRLFTVGTPFFLFGATNALQPGIDALFLSKLGSAKAVGWYGITEKLQSVLVQPGYALVVALYPTLCRLHKEDKAAFCDTTFVALRGTFLLALPVALGTFIFADDAIALFQAKTFGPAADNLRILAFFDFLVYLTMPISTCVMAAGRNRLLTLVQLCCVIVSLVGDPLTIPYFEETWGNGGLGVCCTRVLSEMVVLVGSILLMPRGIFRPGMLRIALRASAAGALMLGLAWSLMPLSVYVAAPISVMGYATCLWLLGELDKELIRSTLRKVVRKIRRA